MRLVAEDRLVDRVRQRVRGLLVAHAGDASGKRLRDAAHSQHELVGSLKGSQAARFDGG